MFPIGSYLSKRCVVFGCGNPLFGDDGFGASVIAHLATHHQIPKNTACVDIGTAIRDFLFDMLLSPERPQRIIIVDAMTLEQSTPGRIHEIDINQIHPAKISDFSLHQFPTTNMLKEIQEGTDIEVRLLVVHPERLPEEVSPGLSPAVAEAVPEMCRRIMDIVGQAPPGHSTGGGGSQ